jgi:hypothetical protein
LFALYISPIAKVVGSFGVDHAQYADDTQLYVALKDTKAVPTLTECITDVHQWLDLNGLSLNPDKTEAIVIGTAARQRADGPIAAVNIGTVCIPTARFVKSLGVTIDETLSFNTHVDNICKSSYFHLRALRKIRKWISEDSAKSIACATVASRLDYCNSLLYGTSAANLQKIQRVQNSLARVVTRSCRFDHITPVLAKLHWLPIQHRIHFKIALIAFKVITTQKPHYLFELIQPHVASRVLRSRGNNTLHKTRTKTVFSDRSFSHSLPTIWNSLPHSIISDLSISLSTFKSRLKTELYNRAFRR